MYSGLVTWWGALDAWKWHTARERWRQTCVFNLCVHGCIQGLAAAARWRSPGALQGNAPKLTSYATHIVMLKTTFHRDAEDNVPRCQVRALGQCEVQDRTTSSRGRHASSHGRAGCAASVHPACQWRRTCHASASFHDHVLHSRPVMPQPRGRQRLERATHGSTTNVQFSAPRWHRVSGQQQWSCCAYSCRTCTR